MSCYVDMGLKVHGPINVQKSVPVTTQFKPEYLRFNGDPMGVVECPPGHGTWSVDIRGELF